MTIKNLKGKGLNISCSSISTWGDCQRKWWYSYMERREGADSVSRQLGTAVHDYLEARIKGEEPQGSGEFSVAHIEKIAGAGLHHLPFNIDAPEETAAAGWEVEEWVAAPCGPLRFVGKVDVFNMEAGHILDHKTCGSWYYCLDSEGLANHVQPLSYSYALFKDDPPDTVEVTYVYYKTKGSAGSRRVDATVSWAMVEEAWQRNIRVAEAMAKVATTAEGPEQVLGNTSACGKYGGCPHEDVCALSRINRETLEQSTQKAIQHVGQPQMQKMEELRARLLAGKKKALAPEPAAPEPAPEPAAPVADLSKALAVIDKVLNRTGVIVENSAHIAAKDAGVTLADVMATGKYIREGSFIKSSGRTEPVSEDKAAELRNDESPAEPPAEGEPVPAWVTELASMATPGKRMPRDKVHDLFRAAELGKRFRDAGVRRNLDTATSHLGIEFAFDKKHVWQVMHQAMEALPDQDMPPRPTTPKADEQRRAREAAEAATAARLAHAAKLVAQKQNQEAPPAEPEPAPVSSVVPYAGEPVYLFVGCAPASDVTSNIVDFNDFIAPFESQVEAEGGKVNGKFTAPVKYWRMIDYSQGGPRIIGAMLDAIRDGHSIPSIIFDQTHPLEVEALSAILRAMQSYRANAEVCIIRAL